MTITSFLLAFSGYMIVAFSLGTLIGKGIARLQEKKHEDE
jgi:hypothetical protein